MNQVHSAKIEPPISKSHIYWVGLLIGLIFTYTGVDANVLEIVAHPSFIISIILNTLQAYLLIGISYYLHFIKRWNFWYCILLIFGAFYLIEFISYQLGDYNALEKTELFTITLPFGSFIILSFNIIYHLLNRHRINNQASNDLGEADIWLDTISGRKKVLVENILFGHLTETNLEIYTSDSILKSFYSLKQLEDLLNNSKAFFRLNKQFLSHRKSVLSYKALADGRLEISLPHDKKCMISKNKASSFKKWLNEF